MKGRPSETFSAARQHLRKGALDLIVWQERLSVGIQELDSQHRDIFVRMNEVSTSMFAGTGGSAVVSLVDRLMDVTKAHFVAEERKMRAHGFLAYGEHRGHHERLLSQLRELRVRSEAGGRAAVETMTEFKNELFDHVLEEDRRYSEFLKSRGVR